jgi:hypothetical protein
VTAKIDPQTGRDAVAVAIIAESPLIAGKQRHRRVDRVIRASVDIDLRSAGWFASDGERGRRVAVEEGRDVAPMPLQIVAVPRSGRYRRSKANGRTMRP